jgi:hypothetical protein
MLNSEVMELLKEKGALSTDCFSTAATVEKQAAEYLSDVHCITKHDRTKSLALKAELEAKQLPSSEVFQIINLKPRSLVEVHLIIENMDERFGDSTDSLAEEILALVEYHFPKGKKNMK